MARQLPSRIARDNLSFRCEEKLDKWLDFGPAYALINFAKYHKDWDDLISDDVLKYVTKETIYEFKAHGVRTDDIGSARVSPKLIADVQYNTLTRQNLRSHLSDKTIRDTLNLVRQAARQSVEEQHTHLTSNMHQSLTEIPDQMLTNILDRMNQWPQELMSSYLAMEDWMEVLRRRRCLHEYVAEKMPGRRVYKRWRKEGDLDEEDPFSMLVPSIGYKVLLCHDYSLIERSGVLFLVPDDLLLGIINKVSEMFCALLYSYIQSGVLLPDDHFDCVTHLYRVLCQGLLSQPMMATNLEQLHEENKVFSVLKGMEGLGVAMIIGREDELAGWENTSLLNTMWRELYMSGVINTPNIYDHPLGEALLRMSTPQIADVIGTVKLFGHPAIEIRLGARQLYERTHEDLVIDPEAVRGGIGILKRDLIRSFYIKHKRYPNINLNNERMDPHIRRLWDAHVPMTGSSGSAQWNLITPRQWETVELAKNAEFDPVDNQLPLIKDKALGLTRSQIFNLLIQDCDHYEDHGEWDVFQEKSNDEWTTNRELYLKERIRLLKDKTKTRKQVKNELLMMEEEKQAREDASKRRVIRTEQRRTLLSFLLSPNFSEDFRRYLHNYENDVEWRQCVLNYLVIKLTAKELELKAMGRFFGASPAEERNRRVVQDKNVMSIMSQHFPDQLMTPDDLGIMKKLVSFRYFADIYPHHVLFQVSFDFSKWNNSMRAASIDIPAAEILDKWFGRKLFGKTMRAYEHMLVYLREPDYKRWWQGQLGGIEGLNQATWSLIFLGGIKHALEAAGVKYQVTVKGDDVRAAIAVPQEQVVLRGGYETVRDDIMTRIQDLCRSMGWQLNPQESFVSLSLIATSKQYQVRKVWLPAASKKIMKMMSLSNILFPTLEDLIGSIFSCAHSACSQATAIYPAYISATIVAAHEFVRSFGCKHLTAHKLTALLMWPQILGGPGSLPLQTFFVRGENDMLSVTIALYCSILRDSANESLKGHVRSIISTKITPNPDEILLLSDPYAISLEVPERPSSLLKRLIRAKLKGWVKNVDIQRLLTDQSERDRQHFIHYLFSMSPYFGKVATAIWENTPFYLIEEVLAKFMESPTVVALFSSGIMTRESTLKAYQALSLVIKAARNRWMFWLKALTVSPTAQGSFLGVPIADWMNPAVCPTKIAYMVRNYAWKKDIVGVTYPSLVTQCMIAPSGMLKMRFPDWRTDKICMQVEIKKDNVQNQTGLDSHHYASRPQTKPWVGSQTSPSVKLPGIETKHHSPTLNKLMKLILITRITTLMGPAIQELCKLCIRSLTPLDINPLLQLTPQGGEGHTTHRLSINAYSMNTMPNYRLNILQLTQILRDTMMIFRNDGSDRTINYAALHFFHAALCVLPLQVNQFLPDSYPSNLEVMFHPEYYGEQDYQVCQWCCRVVDDNVQITFTGNPPLSLHRFSGFQLVGCSQHDHMMLQESVREFMESRIDANLVMEERDVNDPIVREAAAATIINQMRSTSSLIHTVAHSMQYQRIPHGEVLNSCLANLGLSSIYKVSVSILRCIPAETLYMNLLKIIFMEFIRDTAHYNMDEAIAIELTKSPWNNQLTYLFDQIKTASLIPTLVDGCRQVGLLVTPFVIRPGSQNSGFRLAHEFMKAHLGLFRSFSELNVSIPDLKTFIHFQGDESIVESLEHFRITITKWIMRCVNQQTRPRGAIHDVIVKLRYFLNGAEIIWDRMHYETEYMWLSAVGEIHPNLIDHFFALISRTCTQTYVHQAEDHIPYSHTWINIILMTLIDQYINPGDINFLRADEILAGREYQTFYYQNPSSFVPVDQSGLGDDLIAFQVLGRRLPPRLLTSLYRAVIQSVETSDLWDPQVVELWFRGDGKLTQLATHFSRFMIAAQTIEESERILRSRNINDPRDHFNRHVAGLMERRGDELEGRRMRLEANFLHRCRVGDGRDHRDVQDLPYIESIVAPVPRNRLDAAFGNVPTRDEYQRYHTMWADPLEYRRCVGRNNTSLTKYLDILADLHLGGAGLIDPDLPSLHVCLADGIGGVTAYLASLSDQFRVVHNSLKIDPTTDRILPDAAVQVPPLETLDPFFPPTLRSRINYASSATGDLTKLEVQNTLIADIRGPHLPVSIITMDADINWGAEEKNYHDVLFGALYVAAHVMSGSTICIFKTFCIKELSILKFLTAISALFRHVHIMRSPVTRQHSTEIFVVFQSPRDLQVLQNQSVALKDFRRNYPYNPEIENYIASRIQPIAAEFTTFRHHGLSGARMGFRRFIEKLVRNRGYLIQLSSILNWFQTLIDPMIADYCTIHQVLLHEARAQYTTRMNILMTCTENNGYAFLNTTSNNVVTGGWQHLRLEVQRITKLLVLIRTYERIPRFDSIIPPGVIRVIRDEVYRGLAEFFQGPIQRQQLRFIDTEDQVVAVTVHYEDSITLIIRSAFHKLMQIQGCLIAISSVANHQMYAGEAERLLSSFSPSMRFNECCTRAIRESVGLNEVELTPTRGIELTHVDWGNQPGIQFDYERGIYPEQIVRDRMDLGAFAPISTDEDLVDELIAGAPEPNVN